MDFFNFNTPFTQPIRQQPQAAHRGQVNPFNQNTVPGWVPGTVQPSLPSHSSSWIGRVPQNSQPMPLQQAYLYRQPYPVEQTFYWPARPQLPFVQGFNPPQSGVVPKGYEPEPTFLQPPQFVDPRQLLSQRPGFQPVVAQQPVINFPSPEVVDLTEEVEGDEVTYVGERITPPKKVDKAAAEPAAPLTNSPWRDYMSLEFARSRAVSGQNLERVNIARQHAAEKGLSEEGYFLELRDQFEPWKNPAYKLSQPLPAAAALDAASAPSTAKSRVPATKTKAPRKKRMPAPPKPDTATRPLKRARKEPAAESTKPVKRRKANAGPKVNKSTEVVYEVSSQDVAIEQNKTSKLLQVSHQPVHQDVTINQSNISETMEAEPQANHQNIAPELSNISNTVNSPPQYPHQNVATTQSNISKAVQVESQVTSPDVTTIQETLADIVDDLFEGACKFDTTFDSEPAPTAVEAQTTRQDVANNQGTLTNSSIDDLFEGEPNINPKPAPTEDNRRDSGYWSDPDNVDGLLAIMEAIDETTT